MAGDDDLGWRRFVDAHRRCAARLRRRRRWVPGASPALRPRRGDARAGAARRPAGVAARAPASARAWPSPRSPTCGRSRQVARRHRSNPPRRWRTAAFLARPGGDRGGPVLSDRGVRGALFSVHMLQHMLLELVAAPLLLLGAPATLALRAASPSVRRGLLAVLHSRAVAVLSFPLLAWVLFAAVNWGWHFSTLYDQALENVPAARPPAPDLPGRRAPLLVAGGRRRSGPMAAAPPGAPLLPLPGHAPELVPGDRPDERPDGAVPALPDQPARLGSDAGRRPERGRDADVGRSGTSSSCWRWASWSPPGCATRTGAPPAPMRARTREAAAAAGRLSASPG